MAGIPYGRLSAVYFAYLALLGGFIPFWNLYLETHLHFTPALIGQLMAITMITRLVAPVFWGRVGDRTGRRLPMVQLSSLALAMLWCGMFFVSDWWVVALMLLATSFFQNAILAPFEAVTMAHLGSRRAHYGRVRLWGSIGFMVSVTALGVLFDAVSLRWLPLLLALAAFATCLATMRVPDVAVAPCPVVSESTWRILRRREVLGFLGAGFLLQVAHAPYYAFYSLYLETHHYSRAGIGWLWALGMAAEIVAFTQMHRILPAFGERRVLLAALALAAVRWIGIGDGVDSVPCLVLMQLLHAATFAAFHAACISLVAKHFGAGHQGQGQAVYGMLWGLGTALGAWGAGQAWDVIGAEAVFGLAAATSLVALFWVRVSVPETGQAGWRAPAT